MSESVFEFLGVFLFHSILVFSSGLGIECFAFNVVGIDWFCSLSNVF